jgi:predicted AlkP superfamily pyrophosphatase or phosphodiesterase
VDGLSPQILLQADTPNIDRLWQGGAYSWQAQTILPSATLPAHTAMLTGLPPEATGVTYNTWSRGEPYVAFPTVLSLAHDAGLSTAVFIGKGKLEFLFPPGSVDHLVLSDNDAQAALGAAAYIVQARPALTFVHLVAVDAMGHTFGWGSDEQRQAVELVDRAVGRLLAALDKAGIADSTAVLLTSDHGGHGTIHGSDRPEDMTIVWILCGPGIAAGKELSTPIYIYDTAATVAYALGLPVPGEWQGRPVLEAFTSPSINPSPTPKEVSR